MLEKSDREFSIGPSNEAEHNAVIEFLTNNGYNIVGMSYSGDHWSEIHVIGNYNMCYENFINTQISFEAWD